jgi:hypothetical protein
MDTTWSVYKKAIRDDELMSILISCSDPNKFSFEKTMCPMLTDTNVLSLPFITHFVMKCATRLDETMLHYCIKMQCYLCDQKMGDEPCAKELDRVIKQIILNQQVDENLRKKLIMDCEQTLHDYRYLYKYDMTKQYYELQVLRCVQSSLVSVPELKRLMQCKQSVHNPHFFADKTQKECFLMFIQHDPFGVCEANRIFLTTKKSRSKEDVMWFAMMGLSHCPVIFDWCCGLPTSVFDLSHSMYFFNNQSSTQPIRDMNVWRRIAWISDVFERFPHQCRLEVCHELYTYVFEYIDDCKTKSKTWTMSEIDVIFKCHKKCWNIIKQQGSLHENDIKWYFETVTHHSEFYKSTKKWSEDVISKLLHPFVLDVVEDSGIITPDLMTKMISCKIMYPTVAYPDMTLHQMTMHLTSRRRKTCISCFPDCLAHDVVEHVIIPFLSLHYMME